MTLLYMSNLYYYISMSIYYLYGLSPFITCCSDGRVILRSPVLPLMEGDAVTLHCRSKTTTSNLTADFYKDGVLMESRATGKMTINRVSKSDEGLYKCSIPGLGVSPGSWLIVKGKTIYKTKFVSMTAVPPEHN